MYTIVHKSLEVRRYKQNTKKINKNFMYTIVYKGSQEVRFFRVWALLTRSKKHFCFVFGLIIVTKDLIDVSLSYFSHHGYDEKVTVALSFRRIRGSLRVDHF